ncbi:anthranilate phosphoribosyltransferase [Angustibacter aerolatus]
MDTSAPAPTWSGLLQQLLAGASLTSAQSAWAMDQVMIGAASPVQLSGFLVALRAKGEDVEELTGLVRAMLSHAVPIEVPGAAVDVVGTGGDRAHTVNISTMAALVVAGSGELVVKHGNRAASSACGSADVLEALGVRLDLRPADVAAVAAEAGITFCFAGLFHPAMRHAAAVRSGLGVATAFNFLGPLTNPAQPTAAAVGVADARMAPLVAGVLADRGASALVFLGDDGLDELTTSGPSHVWLAHEHAVRPLVLDPAQLGVPAAGLEQLRGGDAAHNAQVVRDVLGGATGPIRDAVLLNAAAALAAVRLLDGSASAPGDDAALAEVQRKGLQRAADSVDSGSAAAVLTRWVDATRSRA